MTDTHTHTHTHACIYIYIYIYVCVCVCVCIFWHHFFIDTYLIEHNWIFLSTYFFVKPFELPYWSYYIWRELYQVPWDLGSIPGRVILKTLKMVPDTSLLNTQQYKVRIEGKVEQSRERSSSLPSLRCSSYRKGSLRIALDYGHQLYFLLIRKDKKKLNQICFYIKEEHFNGRFFFIFFPFWLYKFYENELHRYIWLTYFLSAGINYTYDHAVVKQLGYT